jgi:mRNA-degrading endonuclease RelE of RelBE toxin-antitoxin system
MRFESKPSFEDSFKSLPSKEKREIKQVAIQLIDILSQDRFIHKGIGLKKLKDDYWEVRYGLKRRIILRWHKDLVEFILAGSHNDVKRYLRRV